MCDGEWKDLPLTVSLLATDAEVEVAAADLKAAKEAAEAAACTAAKEQLADAAGATVEGMPKAEYNAVYLWIGDHDGCLRFESPEGKHLYRQIERREWQLADRFDSDAEYTQAAEIKTPDGMLPT